ECDGNKVVNDIIFGPGRMKYRYCKDLMRHMIETLHLQVSLKPLVVGIMIPSVWLLKSDRSVREQLNWNCDKKRKIQEQTHRSPPVLHARRSLVGFNEAYDRDIAFTSVLETFGGGHNDSISVAFE
ncbi:hypothetical protein S245_063610, partial [Arachis hypogaea]